VALGVHLFELPFGNVLDRFLLVNFLLSQIRTENGKPTKQINRFQKHRRKKCNDRWQ
jgi:hypothetical protein